MKRIHLLSTTVLAVCLTAATTKAQTRVAFVDTKYILERMPEYESAQKELDRLSAQWQTEVEERHAMIKRMRDAYNAEAILLTEEMKTSRMADIDKREREARDLQKKRFGVGGDIFKKRQELIQPIQDQIYQAVKEVAGTNYVAVFELGGNSGILFANQKFDKTGTVMRKLGIKDDKDSDSGNTRGNDEQENDGGGGEEQQDAPKEETPPRGGDGGGNTVGKPR
jgi:outer membrane protein